MKLESKYFDYVRVKPDHDRLLRERLPSCQWQGCSEGGEFRAPMGRGREGRFFLFCLAHVQAYNKSYNYFQGMSDDEVAAFQKSAVTGHRPTWNMGSNATDAAAAGRSGAARFRQFERNARRGPESVFADDDEAAAREEKARRQPLGNMARKSLQALNLDGRPSKTEIKNRFKDLVKRHHPDVNGGDKGSEDRLREIIQAYNYLKQAGLC
jgi:curved DNA-binding protein CbpA